MSTPDKRDWLKRTASTVTGESVEDSPPENAPGRLMRMLSTVTGGGSPSSKSSPPKDKKLPSPGRLSRMFQSVGRKQIAINNVDNGGKDRAANAFAAAIEEAGMMDVDESKLGNNELQDEETKGKSLLLSMKARLEKKRTKIASKGAWNLMRRDIAENGRKHLEAELLANADNPDLSMVVKLGHTCLDKPHHNSDAAYSGALLFEWAHFRGFELDLKEKALLAKAHAEIWQSRGLAAENFHLDRSRLLYDETLRANPDLVDDSATWLDFARVLLASGASEEAIGVFQHMLVTFEGDPEIPNWLFYMGATLKAKGLHDEAANYLFESASSGPPRFFGKLDMMFIISRNIEEEGTKRGEPNEEAYEMVFQHLQLEGKLPSELSYEDWLHDSNTWRILADKCALHGMFSLSTDLYAQGLMKDLNAFKKPKLWFGFAKSCHRCKRDSDARLAIKQAITMDPYNRQLEKADEILNTETHMFEEYMESSISDIIDRLHKHHDKDHKGASRLQAMFKGKSERRGLLKSVGSRTEGAKKMVASRAVLLGGSHPVFLHAKASWLGTVNAITATDMEGTKAVLMLADPFTPIKELSSLPRKFKLRMAANAIDDQHHEIVLSFFDEITNEFIQRSFTLSFREEYGQTSQSVVRRLKFKDTHDTVTDISAFEAEKGAVNFLGTLFFYHVRVEDEETIFSFTHPLSGRRLDVVLSREHIDRSQNLVKASRMLLSVCQSHPDMRQKVFDLPEGVAPNSRETNADEIRENLRAFSSSGFVPIPHTDKRVAVNVREGTALHASGGLVLEFREASGKAVVTGHLEKLVAHFDRPLTKDEKAAIEYNEAVHSSKPALRRAASSRKLRRQELERAKTANKDLFNMTDVIVEKAHKEKVDAGKLSNEVSAENSVSSALRDVYVAGMDDHRIHTDLQLTDEAMANADHAAGDELLTKLAKKEKGGAASGKKGGAPNSPGRGPKKEETKKDVALRIAAAKKSAANKDTEGAKADHEENGGDDDVSVLTQESSEKKGDEQQSQKQAQASDQAQEDAEPESQVAADGGSLEGDEDEESDDEPMEGAVSAKNRRKEERRLARKKAMKAKLEKGANTSSVVQFGEEDEEEKKKERDRKKKAAREKMMQEKARMEALAREKRREREQVSSLTEDDLNDLTEKKTVSTKKERKRASQKAAIDAAVFLKHQEARTNASEYLLERSRNARRKIVLTETTTYLAARANAAKLQAMEMEQEQKMREEREAREIAGAESSMGKMGRKMMGLKGKGKKLMASLKGRRNRKASDSLDSGDEIGVEMSRGTDSPTTLPGSTSADGGDEEAGTLDGGASSSASAEDAEVAEISDSRDAAVIEEAHFDSKTLEVAVEEEEEVDEEARLRAAVAEAAKKPKAPKLSRYPVFVKPVIPRESVKIEMFQKPTLSMRQQYKLRRPMSPADLPDSAFNSAEGLIEALRAYYSGAPLPVRAPAPAPAPIPDVEAEPVEETKTDLQALALAPVPAPAPAPFPVETASEESKAPEQAHLDDTKAPETEEGKETDKQKDASESAEVPTDQASSAGTEPALVPSDEASGAVSAEPSKQGVDVGSGEASVLDTWSVPQEPVQEATAAVSAPEPAPAPVPAQEVPNSFPEQEKGQKAPLPLSMEDALSLADSVEISPIKRSKGAIRPFVPTEITQKPLPINAHLSFSLFDQPGFTQVAVIQDQRIHDYLARKRSLEKKKTRLAELGRTVRSDGRAMLSKSTSALPSSPSLSALDREIESLGPFDPAKSVNNLSFLDALSREPSIEVGKKSVNTSKSRGYSGSDGEYASHWRRTLEKCIFLYRDGRVLKKAILSLLKLCPHNLTKLEAFCALADSEGSQIEALGRLADPEFLREVKLVCNLLPVLEILSQVDGVLSQSDICVGGARAASPNSSSRRLILPESAGLSAPNTAQSKRRHAGPSSPGMMQFLSVDDSPASHKAKTVDSSAALKAIRHMTLDEPTAFETQYSPGIPGTAPGEVRAQMAASTHSATSVQSVGTHGSAGMIRVHTTAAETVLPHMNMEMGSPIVQSRGTAIRMLGSAKAPAPETMTGAITTGGFNTHDSLDELHTRFSASDAISTGQKLGRNASGDTGAGSGLNSGLGSAQSPSPTRPIRSSSPLSFNATRERVPKTEGNKSYSGSIDNIIGRTGGLRPSGGGSVGGMSSLAAGSVTAAAAQLPGPLKQSSVRLAHAIDAIYERSPANVVVMCRRDAQRAAGEEVLSRSTLEEMRSKATKRSDEMIELRSSRAAKSTAISFGMHT